MIFFRRGKYKLSPQVKRVMKAENISEAELEDMVKRAAIVTHPDGNRRYQSWLMQVNSVTVTLLRKFELTQVGAGKPPMQEECGFCEGDGCKYCGWAGNITRWI